MNIMSMLNQIKEGDIVLPAIQRDFVWEESKIEKLMDSIMRGYPIGIALLWETYEDIQARKFVVNYKATDRHAFADNTQRRKLKLVLDGQQRLQSLYVSLYGVYKGKHLCFDILSGQDSDDSNDEKYIFVFLTKAELNELNKQTKEECSEIENGENSPEDVWYYLKASNLFCMDTKQRKALRKRVCRELKLSEDADDLIEDNLARFDEVLSKDNNILKTLVIDENLASDSPSRKTESDILEIFVRINRQGTPLNRSDLIFSMLKLNWTASAEALPEFVANVNRGNSFNITTDFVIRCLYAVSDLGTKLDIDLLRKKTNMEKIKSNFTKCCSSISSAVDFIQQHCWCSSSRALGGFNNMVPLVYYLFHRKGHTVPQSQIANVRKSIYMFGFSMAFSRYADSRLGKFIKEELKPHSKKASAEFPYHAAVWWINYWTKCESINGLLLEGNYRLALHLLQRQSGGQAHLRANVNEVDHIFPRAELRKKNFDESEINHFANFWLLSKNKNQNKSNRHPKKFFVDVSDADLKKACINRDMLTYSKYRRFIKERSQQIIKTVQKKLDIGDSDFDFEENSD